MVTRALDISTGFLFINCIIFLQNIKSVPGLILLEIWGIVVSLPHAQNREKVVTMLPLISDCHVDCGRRLLTSPSIGERYRDKLPRAPRCLGGRRRRSEM